MLASIFSSNFSGDLLFPSRWPSSVRSHEQSDKLLSYKRTLPRTEGGRRVVGWAERGTSGDQGEAWFDHATTTRTATKAKVIDILPGSLHARRSRLCFSLYFPVNCPVSSLCERWTRLLRDPNYENYRGWFFIMLPSCCNYRHNEIPRCVFRFLPFSHSEWVDPRVSMVCIIDQAYLDVNARLCCVNYECCAHKPIQLSQLTWIIQL